MDTYDNIPLDSHDRVGTYGHGSFRRDTGSQFTSGGGWSSLADYNNFDLGVIA